jgi:LPXTG-site transpeptidase (sortase) family protein
MQNDPLLITRNQAIHIANRENKSGSLFKKIIKELLYLLAIFIISFTIVNFPALSSKIKYWWSMDIQKHTTPPIASPPIQTTPNNQENSILSISKINIKAPIIWDIPGENLRPKLDNGVAHFAGTAHPGEIGNTFIVGHSSDYVWSKGKYKNIFALLNKLKKGDKIIITYKSITYTYEVTGSKIVKPTATEVLNPTSTPTLSLMTCWPVGTTNSRLIILAKLISPQISPNNVITQPNANALPNIR